MSGTDPVADERMQLKNAELRNYSPKPVIVRSRFREHPAAQFRPLRKPTPPSFSGRTTLMAPASPSARRSIKVVEKICVIGDAAVGKTSLVRRFANDKFDDEYLTTCGAKVMTKKLNLRYPQSDAQVRLMLQLWDVTGQNVHSGLNPAFFKGASGAMVVSEAIRLDTQLDIWKWVEGFRAVAGNVPVMIAVNKTDIMDQREFDYLLMDDISAEYGCLYTMTSARTGENVEGAFKLLCDFIVRTKLLRSPKGAQAC